MNNVFLIFKTRVNNVVAGMKLILITLTVLLFSINAQSQTTFQKTFGGTNDDFIYAISPTSGAGYIMVGSTRSFGAGLEDIYVVRIDSIGDTLWTRTFGGTDYDYANSVVETSSGGFIVAATSDNLTTSDMNLLRLDASGNIIWAKTYGRSGFDFGHAVQETNDEGYIIAGTTWNSGGSMYDAYLIKTDALGDTLWTKTYGGADNESGKYNVKQTSDSGFIMAGWTESFGAGNTDVYLIRTNERGDTIWTRTYGGTGNDYVYDVMETADHGFVFAGSTSSFGAGAFNPYLTRVNSFGNVIWSKTYGGSGFDSGGKFKVTSDGGYIITGAYNPSGTQNYDVYLIRTDSSGNFIWAKTFGGTDADQGYDIQQANDGGYMIAGMTRTFGAGNADVYLIRTDSMGISGCNQTSNITVTGPAFLLEGAPLATVSSGAVIYTSTLNTGAGSSLNTLCFSTSLMEIQSYHNVQIYPNPTSGNVTILYQKEFTDGHIEILNMVGEKVIEKKIHHEFENKLSLQGISAGIYFIKIDTKGESYVQKLIIQ